MVAVGDAYRRLGDRGVAAATRDPRADLDSFEMSLLVGLGGAQPLPRVRWHLAGFRVRASAARAHDVHAVVRRAHLMAPGVESTWDGYRPREAGEKLRLREDAEARSRLAVAGIEEQITVWLAPSSCDA